MLGCLLTAAVALFLSWWYISYYRIKKQLSIFPGPPVIPIVGNVYSVKLGKDLIPSLMQLHKKYGEIVRIHTGLAPKLIFAGVKPIQFILSNKVILDKTDEAIFFSRWLGDGIILGSADKWKIRRKMLTPAFHPKALQNYLKIINTESDRLVTKLESLKKGLDVFPVFKVYVLGVVLETVLNTPANAQQHKNYEYANSVDRVLEMGLARCFSFLKRHDWFYKLSSDYQKEKGHLKILNEFADTLIKRRHNELKSGAKVSRSKLNVLDILLTETVNGAPLTNEEIRYEVHNFLLAGYGTVSAALAFTCFLLSNHQDVQEKVIKELRNIIGKDTRRSLTYHDVQNMKYLEQVIKETLRLYPGATFLSRTLQEDAVYNGQILPKNLSVTVLTYAMHYNDTFYPNPEVFDPDRFNDENSKHRSPYAFIPFSFGIRSCMGQKFAMIEMKCTVANILRNFKILPFDDHEPIVNGLGVIKSDNGIYIRLEKRIISQ